MVNKHRVSLMVVIVLAASLPTGFALGQVVNQPESEQPPITHLDPDPSTDPIVMREALEKAVEEGDRASIDKATSAIHDEWLSRLGDEERVAAEAASPQPEVPAGTVAYVSDAVTPEQAQHCREVVAERGKEALCELIILHDEGKLRTGAFTDEQIVEALGSGIQEGGAR